MVKSSERYSKINLLICKKNVVFKLRFYFINGFSGSLSGLGVILFLIIQAKEMLKQLEYKKKQNNVQTNYKMKKSNYNTFQKIMFQKL